MLICALLATFALRGASSLSLNTHQPPAQTTSKMAPKVISRRATLATCLTPFLVSATAFAEDNTSPKFVQSYADFTESPKGYSFKDVKEGTGNSPNTGDRAVYEWSGYTIGYFGRPFEAKG
mmetsp:Transcript_16512/g.37110  ORF Transcript_16512/g.37110 Transcript_16512/m.37110 type:complete len:121 (-) Transcript_16512:658-1020(-)